MANYKSFPKDMPGWQAIQDNYNQMQDQADAPLFVQPSELQSAEIVDGDVLASPIALDNQMSPPPPSNIPANFQGVPVDSSQAPQKPDSPLSRREKLFQEYMDLQKNSQKELEDARSQDRMLKVGGSIGDALATYLNAQSQMNVKAPGVQVQQGAGLGKVADMFQTAPDKTSDMKQRREDLLAQYKSLSESGELNPYQIASLQMQRDRLDLQRELEQGRGGRFSENLDFRKQEVNELKPKEMDTLYGFETALDSLEKLEGMNKNFLTGPIEGRVSAISRYIGKDSAKKTKLAAQMQVVLSRYAKQISGTAVGEEEFERLSNQLPKETDSDQAFSAKLANFKDELESSRNRFINEYGKIRDVSKFRNREKLTEIKQNENSAFPKTVRRVNPETNKTESAVVKNEQELAEAKSEGFN